MCSAFLILFGLKKKSPDADQSGKKSKQNKKESLLVIVECGHTECEMKWK
jgi:hypothetical protein